MTLRQIALFGFIADSDPRATSSFEELASRLGASKPVITRAIDALSQLGLVVRANDPVDARRRILSVTELGTATRALMKTMAVPDAPLRDRSSS